MVVDLDAQVVSNNGFINTDAITSIEGARGSNQSDILLGSAGDDILFGNGGNDLLVGLGGADVLDGGTGIDSTT